ncbi:DUF6308 family protein [Streptomyces sp. NPDC006692]|uniref:DUF6308 family protein n=1 Tax=Streptomyces sp. NPDC006692 TaxID=3364758 RepID=UPI003695AFD1
MIELKIPEIDWDDEKAVRLLVEHFTRPRAIGDLFYSGAHFERLGGGGDAEHVADFFDSNDLMAITMLGVSLKPHGAINLLADLDGHWARLLSLIPCDARLENPGSDALMDMGEETSNSGTAVSTVGLGGPGGSVSGARSSRWPS